MKVYIIPVLTYYIIERHLRTLDIFKNIWTFGFHKHVIQNFRVNLLLSCLKIENLPGNWKFLQEITSKVKHLSFKENTLKYEWI